MHYKSRSLRATILAVGAAVALLATLAAGSAAQTAQGHDELPDNLDASHPGLEANCFALALERQAETVTDHAERLRAELGLDQSAKPETERTRYGITVTAAEADTLDAIAERQQSVDTRTLRKEAEGAFGEAYVGIHWDAIEGNYVVTTNNDSALSEVDFGEHVAVRVVPQAPGETESKRSSEVLRRNGDELLKLGVEGWHYDETCGAMTVSVFADVDPGPAVTRVNELLGDHPTRFVSVAPADNGPEGRSNYHDPYIGGSRMNIQGNSDCTASMGWYKGSEIWGVTAAHCLPNQTGYTSGTFATVNRNWYQGGQDIDVNAGQSTNYYVYGDAMDMVVVQLDISAANSIMTVDLTPYGLPDSYVAMNWWDWDVAIGAVGDQYCHTGIATNAESCGSLLRKNGTNNYTAAQSGVGVPINLDELWGVSASSASGDSGGPWWRRSGSTRWLAGVHHGKDGGDPAFTHVAYLKSTLGLTAPVTMW